MARPFKTGLDYFDLDCYLDEKVKMIQAEFGLKGFAIVVKLWQVIYRERGYYCEWNEDTKLLFVCQECADCGEKIVDEIVSACIRRDIFSKELFEKYHILTSRGIQKRYFNAVARRGKVEVKKEYLLIKVSKNSINVNKNEVNVDKNEVNARKSTQRRVEKNREENIKADADHSEPEEVDDDEGMDPMEAMRIWKELEKKK